MEGPEGVWDGKDDDGKKERWDIVVVVPVVTTLTAVNKTFQLCRGARRWKGEHVRLTLACSCTLSDVVLLHA